MERQVTGHDMLISMKKDFAAALISLIVFWVLMFIMSSLISAIGFSWIGGGPDLETKRLFRASFSVLTIAGSLCFPFLAVRMTARLRKTDWSDINVRAYSFWILLLLVLYKIVGSVSLLDSYQREFSVVHKMGTGNAAFVSGIVKMALVETCLVWIMFSVAAYRAKKKAASSAVFSVRVEGIDVGN